MCCCCNHVFGGDLDNPNQYGHNKYKLWTRSKLFEGFYCIMLLFSVAMAGFIFAEKQKISDCYQSSIAWIILAHIIKPFIIALFMKFIHCGILRFAPMFFMDIPYAIFVIMFSWLPLYSCLHDEYMNNSNNIAIDGQAILLDVYLLFACLVIHLIFPFMATIRLIEVIVFERRVKKKRQEWDVHGSGGARGRIELRESAHFAAENDTTIDTTISNLSFSPEEKEHEPLNNDTLSLDHRVVILRHHVIDENTEMNEFEDDSSIFVYGDNEPQTSLSNMFAASTKFISSGVFGKINEDDICVICYDNFEKGKLCAKLKCGHIFHRECFKDWLIESATCPVCRASVIK